MYFSCSYPICFFYKLNSANFNSAKFLIWTKTSVQLHRKNLRLFAYSISLSMLEENWRTCSKIKKRKKLISKKIRLIITRGLALKWYPLWYISRIKNLEVLQIYTHMENSSRMVFFYHITTSSRQNSQIWGCLLQKFEFKIYSNRYCQLSLQKI